MAVLQCWCERIDFVTTFRRKTNFKKSINIEGRPCSRGSLLQYMPVKVIFARPRWLDFLISAFSHADLCLHPLVRHPPIHGWERPSLSRAHGSVAIRQEWQRPVCLLDHHGTTPPKALLGERFAAHVHVYVSAMTHVLVQWAFRAIFNTTRTRFVTSKWGIRRGETGGRLFGSLLQFLKKKYLLF